MEAVVLEILVSTMHICSMYRTIPLTALGAVVNDDYVIMQAGYRVKFVFFSQVGTVDSSAKEAHSFDFLLIWGSQEN